MYVKDVRSVVEFAAVGWSSALTQEDTCSIEILNTMCFGSYSSSIVVVIVVVGIIPMKQLVQVY